MSKSGWHEPVEDTCPNCGKPVEFTKEQLLEDPHHMEDFCPHCDYFCCFTCGHVYSWNRQRKGGEI